MKKLKLKEKLIKSTIYICDKCGWQYQKTKMTEKLKEYCKDCNCSKKLSK